MLSNLNPYEDNNTYQTSELSIAHNVLRCFNKDKFLFIFNKIRCKNKSDLFDYMIITPKDYSSPIINSLLLQNELGCKDGNTYLSDLVTDLDFAIKLYTLHIVSDYYGIVRELVMNYDMIQIYEEVDFNPLFWIKFITKRSVDACVFGPLPEVHSIMHMCKLNIINEYDRENYIRFGFDKDNLEHLYDVQKLVIILDKKKISSNDVTFVSIPLIANMLLCSEVMVRYNDRLLLIPNTYSNLHLGKHITCAHNEILKKCLGLPFLETTEKMIDYKSRFRFIDSSTNMSIYYLEIADQEYLQYSLIQSELTTSESLLNQEIVLYLYIIGNRITVTMFDNITVVNYAKISVVVDDRLYRVLVLWKYIMEVNKTIVSDESMERLKSITRVGTRVSIDDYLKRSATSIPKPYLKKGTL
jgi:hypothetical protein